MRKGLVVAAVVAAALVWAGAPAAAQSYPPPVRSITVDDATPAPGQSITVTLRTCRPGTVALIGIDLLLVATPTVGEDGAAVATVTVPQHLRAGRHTVSGLCIAPSGRPLFLTTSITVTPAGGTAGAGGNDTGSIGGIGSSDPSAPAATAPASGSAGSGGRSPAPSVAGLDGPEAPADAATLFEDAAASRGIPAGGAGAADAPDASSRPDGSGDGGPGLVATIARVALGLAAIGGVPVALAVSRRPQRLAQRRSFA
ncbi:MAG TPA: hypothetical protein VFZ77_16795 [Acidimicrobiales bacterium]